MKRYVIPRIGVQELGRLTPAKVVTESLGDANISITLDTCSRLLPALQEDASEKNAALILGGNS